MDRPRFANLFWRQRRASKDKKKKTKKDSSTVGAHELFLEYEGLLPPSNALSPRTQPTPDSDVAVEKIDQIHHDHGVHVPANALRQSISESERPRKSFSGLSRATTIVSSSTQCITHNRKKSFLSLNRSVDEGHQTLGRVQYQPTREPVIEQPHAPSPPCYNWLRRFRSQCRPTTPVTPLPTYCESSFANGHLPAPIPDFGDVPGFGYEQPRPRVDLSSGAAARAAAAAQNELLESMRRMRLVEPKFTRDSESGIGIERGDSMIDPSIPVVRQDPVRMLPLELMEHVLTYLDAGSLLHAELVSREWNNVASSDHIWKQVFRDEFQDTLQIGTARKTKRQISAKATQGQDWKSMWRARKALHQRWLDGHAAAIYLEGHTDSVYCVQFDKDKILTGSRDRTVRVWDAHTYECLRIVGMRSRPTGPTPPPLPMDVLESGQRPFTKVFAPQNTTPISSPGVPHRHSGSILCLQYDDNIMVTGSSDCSLIIWDVQNDYTPTQRLRHHTAGVLDVCFDEKHIVSCSKDTTVCLWSRKTGTFLCRLSGHRGPVNAVQLRGDLVVSASGDGIAKLWNLASGLCIKEFPSKNRGLACVEFSLDSRTILAGGNDQVIYQFDTNTGELVRELKGHGDLVRSLHLDSSSGRVVSGSYDTSVKAFDLCTGENLFSFTKWTSSWILSAKADYRRIVATSQDSRAVIMDFGYELPGIKLLET